MNFEVPEIKDIPRVPSELVRIIEQSDKNESNLVLFIGSGVSHLLGHPRWKDLSNSLIDDCHEHDKENFNFSVREKMLRETDFKKTISIAEDVLGKDSFEKKVKEHINDTSRAKKDFKDIYNLLFDLTGVIYPSKQFITTNIDESFDRRFDSSSVIYQNFEIDKSGKILFKIHGSLNKPNTWVLTIDKYIQRYGGSSFTSFIKKTFSEKSILFIGYGLKDRFISEELIRSGMLKKGRDENSPPRHFWIAPFFSGDKHLFKVEYKFYKKRGIEIIPFNLDCGYDQLYHVIKDWKNNQFPNLLEDLLASANQIEDMI